MFEEKESMWKKKGFYVSVCTALVCLLAIGTTYYRMNNDPQGGGFMKAEVESSEAPEDSMQPVGNSKDQSIADKNKATIAPSIPSDTPQPKATKKPQKDNTANNEKTAAKSGRSRKAAAKDTTVASQKDKKHFAFNEEKGLSWPVKGKVLMKFSMTDAVYFKTLAQYRCNPALIIGGKVGQHVKTAAAGEVLSVSKNDETGKTVTMNIGNGYTLTYGQLKAVSVKEGDELKAGETIGKLAAPSTAYTEEGCNLYFKVEQNGTAVDPLLLLD